MDRTFPREVTDASRTAEDESRSGGDPGAVLSRLRRRIGRVAGLALGWLSARFESASPIDWTGSRSSVETDRSPDTTASMMIKRRGTCARCGLEFDADRGYTALEVFERAAENPREESTERTVRLCDVCGEDFRDFVDLGRERGEDPDDVVPEYLRSR